MFLSDRYSKGIFRLPAWLWEKISVLDHERKGSPELLEKYGEKYDYETIVIAKEMDGNRKISSTYIREELKKGNMEKIADLLGSPFFAAGVIEHGRGMGHQGFFSN